MSEKLNNKVQQEEDRNINAREESEEEFLRQAQTTALAGSGDITAGC